MPVSPHVRGGTDVPVGDGGTGASDAATARTNIGAGVGDLTTAAHAALSHAAVPGTYNQVALHTLNWSNESGPKSTPSLGFTPAFAICIGVFSHNALGGATPFAVTANSSISVGVATGTGSQAASVTQHCEEGGSGDEDTTTHDSNSIAGVSRVNSGAGLSHATHEVDVTAWASSGITLDPVPGPIYARLTLLIVGKL